MRNHNNTHAGIADRRRHQRASNYEGFCYNYYHRTCDRSYFNAKISDRLKRNIVGLVQAPPPVFTAEVGIRINYKL